MHFGSLSHLSDAALLREFAAIVARHRLSTAELLAALGEIDARRLYLRTHHPSLLAWCVGEMRFSEDAAKRRIRAARTARAFPAILPALADGRLSMSTVLALSHHLAPENAAELLAASVGRKESEVLELLAERFPRPDLPAMVLDSPVDANAAGPLASSCSSDALPTPVETGHLLIASTANVSATSPEGAAPPLVPTFEAKSAQSMVPVSTRGKVALLSPGHFGVQFTFEREAHDLMRYAQALASHDIAPGELAKLFEHALRAYVREREKRKFAACVRAPRIAKRGAKPSANPRYVPAPVRREVWMRDGGRCTFVSASGQRCEACERLEFDHVILRAHGGTSTAPNLRLRCRAHNQLTAEQALGRDHVVGARERSGRRAAEARLAKAHEIERAAARSARHADSPASIKRSARAGSAGTLPDPSPAHEAVVAVARAVDEARAAERAARRTPAPHARFRQPAG